MQPAYTSISATAEPSETRAISAPRESAGVVLWQVLLHVSLWNRSENLHSVPLRYRPAKPPSSTSPDTRTSPASSSKYPTIACGT